MAMTRWAHPRPIRYFLFVLAVLLGNQMLLAQATASGNIAGVVTDPTGAAVVGASVTVTSTATNAERKTTTNGSGEYRFDLLPAGTYQLSVQASGFGAAQVKGLQVLGGHYGFRQCSAERRAGVADRGGHCKQSADGHGKNRCLYCRDPARHRSASAQWTRFRQPGHPRAGRQAG